MMEYDGFNFKTFAYLLYMLNTLLLSLKFMMYKNENTANTL